MKIALVTGARGFIGRHLSLALHNENYKVYGIGHGAWSELDSRNWGVSCWLNGDVSNSNLKHLQAKGCMPDLVFHLAGGSSVGPSLLNPIYDFNRSVNSTVELLEWCRLTATDAKVVFASSAAVYGAGYKYSITEDDTLMPFSPYGFHKKIAEQLCHSYRINFGLNVAIVRLFSVYGPELRKQLLWDVCNRLKNNSKELILGGTGEELRDWIHISDVVSLLIMSANQASKNSIIINGGVGDPVAVKEVANHICRKWGGITKLQFSGESRAGDPPNLVANVLRGRAIGFLPQMSWKIGIAEYVEWFKRETSKEVF